MTYSHAKTVEARGQIQLRFAQRAAKAVSALQCLIVSADKRRGEMFERAAADGGWKACRCADVDQALAHMNRSFVHLAIVDLAGQALPSFRPLLEQLRSRSGVLLIVCGNEGNVEEEVCVRQLGAWLYLPDVAETSNLALLCGEARHIAERLAKPPLGDPTSVPAVQHGTYS